MSQEASRNSSLLRILIGNRPYLRCKRVSIIIKKRVDLSGQPFALTEDLESEICLLATGLLIVEAVDSHIDFFQLLSSVVERRSHVLLGCNNHGHIRSQHKAVGPLDALGGNFEYFCHCCYCLVVAAKILNQNARVWQCWETIIFQRQKY